MDIDDHPLRFDWKSADWSILSSAVRHEMEGFDARAFVDCQPSQPRSENRSGVVVGRSTGRNGRIRPTAPSVREFLSHPTKRVQNAG